MLAVLYVVFTSIFPSTIEHFGLYLLLGIILWNTLSRGTDFGLNCLTSRETVITQIYFPLEIPAISATITSFLMLLLELLVFAGFMIALQFVPTFTIILLPLVLLVEFVLVLGLTFSLSILNIKFKDVQFIWRVVLQAGFFATPIIYKLDMLPIELQEILKFSPMVQIVTIAHDVTLYNKLPTLESIIILTITTMAIFLIGYGIFRKLKSRIVEEI